MLISIKTQPLTTKLFAWIILVSNAEITSNSNHPAIGKFYRTSHWWKIITWIRKLIPLNRKRENLKKEDRLSLIKRNKQLLARRKIWTKVATKSGRKNCNKALNIVLKVQWARMNHEDPKFHYKKEENKFSIAASWIRWIKTNEIKQLNI